MERTLITFSFMNLITIPIMALLGFLLVAALYQGGQMAGIIPDNGDGSQS